ncbi:hypothetical protein, partial [Pseudomonas quasicaspiana]|uniref:hypothetical protein n=1 Tax=Pseudomonas quasicaspiana TaxID=2829821 RepID=UPI001E4489A4
ADLIVWVCRASVGAAGGCEAVCQTMYSLAVVTSREQVRSYRSEAIPLLSFRVALLCFALLCFALL